MSTGPAVAMWAQSDFGEILPLLIVVVVVVGRVFKALADRAGGGGADAPPPPVDHGEGGETAGAQLRRFLEDLNRQARGEPMPPPPPSASPAGPPPPLPGQARPRPVPRPARPATAVPTHARQPPRRVAPAAKPAVRAAGVDDARSRGASSAEGPCTVWTKRGRAAPDTAWASPHKAADRRAEGRGDALLAALRRGRGGLREAVVLREVLGPPLSMRRD